MSAYATHGTAPGYVVARGAGARLGAASRTQIPHRQCLDRASLAKPVRRRLHDRLKRAGFVEGHNLVDLRYPREMLNPTALRGRASGGDFAAAKHLRFAVGSGCG
jgi:hypothetical protein